MSNSFNVVLTGELLKGQSIMQAANSLSKLFKIAPIQAQQMLARAPLVIKKNLEEDTALRFVRAMYKSGFGASIEAQKTVKPALFLHPFNTHYEDDDEDSAVTSITPVLVEQSRLEESLDTELTIPTEVPVAVNVVEAVSVSLNQSDAEVKHEAYEAVDVNTAQNNETEIQKISAQDLTEQVAENVMDAPELAVKPAIAAELAIADASDVLLEAQTSEVQIPESQTTETLEVLAEASDQPECALVDPSPSDEWFDVEEASDENQTINVAAAPITEASFDPFGAWDDVPEPQLSAFAENSPADVPPSTEAVSEIPASEF
ncbi:MAG: hypothetical protein RL497_1207, partial [Pseudomonadota bacterium]